MKMIAHQGETKDFHAVQNLQALDEVQKIGLVQIVNGQAGKGSSGNDMVNPS